MFKYTILQVFFIQTSFLIFCLKNDGFSLSKKFSSKTNFDLWGHIKKFKNPNLRPYNKYQDKISFTKSLIQRLKFSLTSEVKFDLQGQIRNLKTGLWSQRLNLNCKLCSYELFRSCFVINPREMKIKPVNSLTNPGSGWVCHVYPGVQGTNDVFILTKA